jgi:PAS domain S-box-containing protein
VLGGAIADRNRSDRLRKADHDLTTILAGNARLKDVAPQLLRAVCETLEWEVGILWQADNERQVLEYVHSWQRDHTSDEFVADSRKRLFKPGLGLPGRVWSSAEPAWIYDVLSDRNFPRADAANKAGLRGAFGFPVLLGGQVLGIIEFFTSEPRKVDPAMLSLMAAAGSQIGQYIDRRRAQRRLIESEALNSSIVTSALDCVISIDEKGRIIEFNPAATVTFGLSRDEALGRELADVIVPERLRERHRAAVRRNVETGEARILGRRMEMPALRADGSEFMVELSIARVSIADRPVFTAQVRDITERKRMEQERDELLVRERNARVQAEQANRSKDQFLATVSHELRTPLTAILGWASMLQSRSFEPERLQQICVTLFRNAQAQAQIVEDLLDVSRIVTGQLRLSLQPVDVCDVARLSLETIRPTAAAKGVTLETSIPSASCIVSGDPARLQQIVWNLMSNAIKFTPSGGSVVLRVREAPSTVVIEVEDTGAGIRPEFLPHVFERFWQADSSTTRVHGGLGLGLALVRHIAELHGGEVRVTSPGEGRGATFTVTLPASIPSGVPYAPARPDQSDNSLLFGRTVLIVDDDPAALELFTAVLESRGVHVVSAASTAEAVQVFDSHHPHAMVVDIGMPGEDGFAFLRRVRAREHASGLAETPAIAVTAYAGAIARNQVLEAGFVAHVPKPALPEEMVSAIQRALEADSI